MNFGCVVSDTRQMRPLLALNNFGNLQAAMRFLQRGMKAAPRVATGQKKRRPEGRRRRRSWKLGQSSFPIATAVSSIRQEKPHSLSYQLRTRHMEPSMTLVWSVWNTEECGSWLKSEETSGSSV